MRGPRFWLLWSWRDLRRRWPLIVAIGLLLAGGVGLAAGLGSMRDWRVDSNDASFGALNVHDLRVQAEQGSFIPTGALLDAAEAIPDADEITAASERLILPTQITAVSGDGRPVTTPGQIVGVETGPARSVDGVEVTGPPVDAVGLKSGEWQATDRPRTTAVLDPQYADGNGIVPPARVELAGGASVEVTGLGTSPETFVVQGPGGAFSGESEFSPVFVPLHSAQRLTGRPDRVNDLALVLRPGSDHAAVARQLEREIDRKLPGLGVTVTDTDDIDGYRILYDDAENDQQLFDVFAFLILAGATFGAFNLISRTVEAQRREIGVGMALGLEPRRLAIRPMLMGLQIAVVGVLFGVVVGLAVNEWLRGLLIDQLPLPIVKTDLRSGTFAQRAAIGFLIPLLAAAWPVMRGVRVTPIEAIRSGFRSSRGGGLAPLLAHVPLPGGSLAQMPARNVVRAPRRTALTVLASGAVVAVAVSMSGMLDSFQATIDRNTEETLKTAPERLTVTLDRFYDERSPTVATVTGSDAVATADEKLVIPAKLRSGDEEIEVSLNTLPTGKPVWTPTVSSGHLPVRPDEVLLAESAASDLGVEAGQSLTLVHPRSTGPGRFESAETEVTVSGTHPDPFRFPVYMASASSSVFGLPGVVNSLDLVPARDLTGDAAKRSLAGLPGIASVESASALGESLEQGLEDFASIIRVVVAIAVVLVLLIAFNSTAINADERAREHATMFAYGLPLRSVLRLAVVESLIMGVLATAIGLILGVAILGWVVNVNLKEVLPELGTVTSLSSGSIILAALAGVGAMALAPVLTVRRLRRMDVPSTLRVVE
ncbi:MAG: FtsX-like permease family protein [Solirubrobacterales bacterium]|nr:FtsX-like permease family protein [Solirubrobacterales bacterium]